MPEQPLITKRTLVIGLLWTVIGLILWLMAIQLAFVVFSKKGEWQAPDFYEVQVIAVDRDTSNAFTRDVEVTIDGAQDTITLPKDEAAALHPYDTLWVFDNYYATPIRPAQFRLTLRHVLAEYPELILLLAILALVRVRRSSWGLPPPPEPIPEDRKVIYKDTFHARAQRHAEAAPPSGEENR